MLASASTLRFSLSALHRKILRGEEIVMELAINATTYMDPDKYFLLKSSTKIRDLIQVLEIIEPETLKDCEIAYFDEDNTLLGEFSAADFMAYYKTPKRE